MRGQTTISGAARLPVGKNLGYRCEVLCVRILEAPMLDNFLSIVLGLVIDNDQSNGTIGLIRLSRKVYGLLSTSYKKAHNDGNQHYDCFI